jgi:hypothetical protein
MPDTTERTIPRREVLAFIALHGDEASMPCIVRFRESHHHDRDWRVVDLTVDSEAAVRHWMTVFGHDEKYLSRYDQTRDDGTRYTSYYSQEDGWRGFTTAIGASVDAPPAPVVALDEPTMAALAELAGAAA